MLLLLIVLLLLFGGGGGYYGYSRWGNRGGIGIVGVVIIIVVVVYLSEEFEYRERTDGLVSRDRREKKTVRQNYEEFGAFRSPCNMERSVRGVGIFIAGCQ